MNYIQSNYIYQNPYKEVTLHTVEPVYNEHLGTYHKCPDYQGVLIIQLSLSASLGPQM